MHPKLNRTSNLASWPPLLNFSSHITFTVLPGLAGVEWRNFSPCQIHLNFCNSRKTYRFMLAQHLQTCYFHTISTKSTKSFSLIYYVWKHNYFWLLNLLDWLHWLEPQLTKYNRFLFALLLIKFDNSN